MRCVLVIDGFYVSGSRYLKASISCSSISTVELDDFRGRYPPQPTRLRPTNEDEIRQLDMRDGVLWLQAPPVETNEDDKKVPRKKGDPGCHLWVFDSKAIPYILERAPIADKLESGVVKHTNLTGGGDASCAGEFWVDPVDENLIFVNGCSGRYGPRTREQLDCAVEVFEQLGYTVTNFGWDEGTNKPEVVLWKKE